LEQQLSKIIVLVGISGSGKSTFAKKYCYSKNNTIIVSRDNVRMLLFGHNEQDLNEYYKDNRIKKKESIVSNHIDVIIRKAIRDGFDIIADNTHLSEKYINNYKKYAVPIEVVVFDDVDKEKCLHLDGLRNYGKAVGEEIINKQWKQFESLLSKIDTIKEDIRNYNSFLNNIMISSKKAEESFEDKFFKNSAIIVDIDGTIAHADGRNLFDFSKVIDDVPDRPLNHLLAIINQGMFNFEDIIICSGREETCREDTEKWLDKNDFSYSKLYMRKKGDYRKDWMVKAEMWEEIQKTHNIVMMIDDRAQVVDFARRLGYKVAQVDYGEF